MTGGSHKGFGPFWKADLDPNSVSAGTYFLVGKSFAAFLFLRRGLQAKDKTLHREGSLWT